MLPIVINPEQIRIGLIGAGDAYQRRLALLTGAGVAPVLLEPQAPLTGILVLFVAGLSDDVSRGLAEKARAQGVLVNVEDVPPLCDFHIPAIVRRGDLLVTISTKGQSPSLASLLREKLEGLIGPEWEERLDELGTLREALRARGVHGEELGLQMRAVIAERGWLK